MPVPIVCADARLRQYLAAYGACFSQPQRHHLLTLVLGLLLCVARCHLTGLRRQVAGGRSVAAVSRFLSTAPWEASAVAGSLWVRFAGQVTPLVAAAHQQQRMARPRRRGRPAATVVTGYLIGDDSTQAKPQGRTMGGLGQHYASTAGKPITGHSLVQGLYVIQGRQCPLLPRMYRQQAVCRHEGVPFQSKIALMQQLIATFTPVPGAVTHVLLDSWYTCKAIWKTARQRGFVITSGLKRNRSLRVLDTDAPRGWRWQRLDDYAQTLTDADYVVVTRQTSQGERASYVHVTQTMVRKLYRCQVVILRESLTAPLSQARFWASTDLTADAATLVAHIATRWQIEVFFADTKEVLGLDHYQLMDATAIVRFWTLVCVAYSFLEEERARLQPTTADYLSIGATCSLVQQTHQAHCLTWLRDHFLAGATVTEVATLLAA